MLDFAKEAREARKQEQIRQQKLRSLSPATAAASIVRASGLKVDFDLLNDRERAELFDLIREIRMTSTPPDGEACHPGVLGGKKQRKWEVLVAKAAGKPKSYFDDLRADQHTKARLRELAERAKVPAPPRRLEERGTIVLPPEVYASLKSGHLDAIDLTVLTVTIAQFQNGPLTPRGTLDGDELLLKGSVVSDRLNPEFELSGVPRSQKHLVENGWLTIQREGNAHRVGLGPVLKAAFARRDNAPSGKERR